MTSKASSSAGLINRRSFIAAAGAASLADAGFAQARPWPDRPIKFLVGWTAGGSADTMGRLLADALTKRLGQTVVVENRPGASGRLAAQAVAKADPDGSTFLFAAISEISIAAATAKQLPYDPLVDLMPVSQVVSSTLCIIASPTLPVRTVPELVAYAKANEKSTSYASFGLNTLNHLFGEQFNLVTGTKSLHIPYKGGSAAWADLMSGRVQYMFEVVSVALPMIQSAKVIPLAVVAPERMSVLPTVPTMKEAGYGELATRSWNGVFAPPKTPAAVVSRMQAEIAAALKSPELSKAISDRGLVAVGNTPVEFGRSLVTEIETWKNVVAKAGLTLE